MIQEKIQVSELWRQIIEESNSKSFKAFFYLLNARLIKFCVFYVHKEEIAEEIVSDVFTNCWLNRDHLNHVKNPESYLYIAVKNQSLNYIKKYSTIHLVSIDEHSSQLVNTYCPQKEMEKRELMFKMDQAIESMPQQCKIIFRLVKEDGLKYKEVAEILNISPKTVHTQIFRAMKRLNAILKPYVKVAENPVIIGLAGVMFNLLLIRY